MNEKKAKQMRKIVGAYPLSEPQKRLYRRCKKAYDSLPGAFRPSFLVTMDKAINPKPR